MLSETKSDRLARETVYVPVRQLSVKWLQSQRPLNLNHAKAIAQGFDPDLFDPVVVTLPDASATRHIIEGQHRVAAVDILWGQNELVPCRVVNASDPARAAQIWEQINTGRKSPKAIDLFNVRVSAGRAENIEITRILAKFGLKVGNRAKGNVSSVAALIAVHRLGDDILERTVGVLTRAYGDDPEAFMAPIVRGVGKFIAEHGNRAHLTKLSEAMQRKYTPGALLGVARSDLSASNHTDAVCKAITALYNRGRSNKL